MICVEQFYLNCFVLQLYEDAYPTLILRPRGGGLASLGPTPFPRTPGQQPHRFRFGLRERER